MSVVGGLLAIRRPGNAIGSVLLGAGLLVAVAFAAGYYANLDDLMGQDRLPFVVPVAWIGTWTFVPAVGLMVVFLPMLFPTGHLPGPRWQRPQQRHPPDRPPYADRIRTLDHPTGVTGGP
jgi:drug/metabolite transporter (DMT)-like permease